MQRPQQEKSNKLAEQPSIVASRPFELDFWSRWMIGPETVQNPILADAFGFIQKTGSD
jgi:hypothetical protein